MTKKQLKQEVWWLMYELACKEPDYLKGMIVKITDSWDDEQWQITYDHMSKQKELRA